mgnify:CR=1 FL=1
MSRKWTQNTPSAVGSAGPSTPSVSHSDGGQRFINRLVTLGTVVFLAVTVLATLGAPLLVGVYTFADDALDSSGTALAVVLAYWCLPQIFFYGLYALVGETLNARRVYGPFTWAPIVNNIVSIAGFLAFIALFSGPVTQVAGWTPDMIALLAGTATTGIVVQAALLLVFWRSARLRVRPDFRWKGVGLAQIGRLAGWTFLMMLAGQVAGLVQTRVLSEASSDGPSVFAFQNAWLLFMLPYSIIVLSIGTPYYTRLSEHASAGRDVEVRDDIVSSIRTLGRHFTFSSFSCSISLCWFFRLFNNCWRCNCCNHEITICNSWHNISV